MLFSHHRHIALRLGAAAALSSLTSACFLSFPEYDVATGGAPGTGGSGSTTGGSSGTGVLQPNGVPCESHDACESNNCIEDIGGGFVCCAERCMKDEPTSCGQTGQCLGGTECALYPNDLVCDPMEFCDGATLYTQRCNQGACEPFGEPCANGLNCAAGGDACLLTCNTPSADCAESSADCFEGKCQKVSGETCSSDDECISGFCGSTGVGHCCAASCTGDGTPCGNDCDDTGACVLAPSTKVCSTTASCTDGNQLLAKFCDGDGACESVAETQPCAGDLTCEDADGCWGSCLSSDADGDARCAMGHWCNGSLECVAQLGVLGLCNRDEQCASGNCWQIWPTPVFICAP